MSVGTKASQEGDAWSCCMQAVHLTKHNNVLLLQNFCLDAAGSNDAIKIIDFGFARMAYGEHVRQPHAERACVAFTAQST
jgi:hypothetical protein